MKQTPAAAAGIILTQLIQNALLEKKAEKITVVPLDPEAGIADSFVICHSDNTVHNRAIADGLVDALAAQGLKPWHVEGREEAAWIVIDYVDVVVHVMLAAIRSFYDLETLWNGRGARSKAH